MAAIEHALEKERDHRTPNIDTFVLELTGQPLAEVAHDESSGVYSPGMPVTPSMSSGATRAPSGGDSGKVAAPAPPSPANVPNATPVAMQGAPVVSGKKLIFGILAVVAIVSGIVVKVRTDNWAERSEYRSRMIDAGYTLLADGTFDMDAGRKLAVAPAAVDDAGTDAGGALAAVVDVVDAGVSAPVAAAMDAGASEPAKPKVPPTSAESALLASFAKLAAAEKWDSIWESRNSLRTKLQTPSAREQGLSLLITATCARNDNAQLMSIVSEYKTVATTSQVRLARARCVKSYPSSEFLDW